jgi:hypothetical protein
MFAFEEMSPKDRASHMALVEKCETFAASIEKWLSSGDRTLSEREVADRVLCELSMIRARTLWQFVEIRVDKQYPLHVRTPLNGPPRDVRPSLGNSPTSIGQLRTDANKAIVWFYRGCPGARHEISERPKKEKNSGPSLFD